MGFETSASSAAIAVGSQTRRLTIVVPTLNEAQNVRPHYLALVNALGPTDWWEVVYVDDDSADGTASILRNMSQEFPNLRVIQRIGRKGLSSAVIEGALSSAAPFIAVMDADLQHDARVLPAMFNRLTNESLHIVIASRFTEGGSTGDWHRHRILASKIASHFSKAIVRQGLLDPMSGYFVMTRSTFENAAHTLSGQGFKILLDIFSSSPEDLRFAEIPFSFARRLHGESKVDSMVIIDYAQLLVDKIFRGYLPSRLVLFTLVGGTGLVVHFTVLFALMSFSGVKFMVAQSVATLVAMTSNFMINNLVTFRDQRLKGIRVITGLLSFYLICMIGFFGNVGIADYLHQNRYSTTLAALVGITIGTVWNYAMNNAITWRQR
jgi:dolichol-phosphate mannosyltransferase